MATNPFVQLEGFLALPRMRPLDRIPPPFGQDWTLLPQCFSLRTEIHALYAAITRTACLRTEAFLSPYDGDSHCHDFPTPTAAPSGVAANVAADVAASAAGGTSATAPGASSAHVAAQPARPKALPRKLVRRARRRARRRLFDTRKFMGGAGAIGGAALLTWIIAGHAPHSDDVTKTLTAAHPNGGTGNSASQQLFAERATHERVMAATPLRRPAQTTAEPSSVASLRHENPAAAARTLASRPDFSVADNPAMPLRSTLPARPAAAGEVRVIESNERVRERAAGDRMSAAQIAANIAQTTQPSAPLATHRSEGKYTRAGSYSPRPAAAPLDDDYASIVTYANMYAAPRPVSRSSIPVDSTEWVSHVSQRRVTEIPDRFVE